MKTLFFSLTAAAALAFAPAPVKAGDNAWAAIGGFIGGVIVGSSVNNHCDTDAHVVYHRDYRDDCRYREPVAVVRAEPRGHWELIRVRDWVPGCWTYERDRRGHLIRAWHPGYYTYTQKRVWVTEYARDDCDRR